MTCAAVLRSTAAELRHLSQQAAEQADRLEALAAAEDRPNAVVMFAPPRLVTCDAGSTWCGQVKAPASAVMVFQGGAVDWCCLACRSRGEVKRAAAVSRRAGD